MKCAIGLLALTLFVSIVVASDSHPELCSWDCPCHSELFTYYDTFKKAGMADSYITLLEVHTCEDHRNRSLMLELLSDYAQHPYLFQYVSAHPTQTHTNMFKKMMHHNDADSSDEPMTPQNVNKTMQTLFRLLKNMEYTQATFSNTASSHLIRACYRGLSPRLILPVSMFNNTLLDIQLVKITGDDYELCIDGIPGDVRDIQRMTISEVIEAVVDHISQSVCSDKSCILVFDIICGFIIFCGLLCLLAPCMPCWHLPTNVSRLEKNHTLALDIEEPQKIPEEETPEKQKGDDKHVNISL